MKTAREWLHDFSFGADTKDDFERFVREVQEDARLDAERRCIALERRLVALKAINLDLRATSITQQQTRELVAKSRGWTSIPDAEGNHDVWKTPDGLLWNGELPESAWRTPNPDELSTKNLIVPQ